MQGRLLSRPRRVLRQLVQTVDDKPHLKLLEHAFLLGPDHIFQQLSLSCIELEVYPMLAMYGKEPRDFLVAEPMTRHIGLEPCRD